jgi:Na+-transporting methylmalonyl-CoA/oxaloacetate decarboxylase gamma subunit
LDHGFRLKALNLGLGLMFLSYGFGLVFFVLKLLIYGLD